LFLPLAQLALNRKDATSMGTSAFFLDHGYKLEPLDIEGFVNTVQPRTIQSTRDIGDPSEQLGIELAVRMTTPIPKPKEANPIKLVQFDIPNLTKQNVRTWKSDVREFCEIQGVWEVVGETLSRQNKSEELRDLLEESL
jgi:hypothetical protein